MLTTDYLRTQLPKIQHSVSTTVVHRVTHTDFEAESDQPLQYGKPLDDANPDPNLQLLSVDTPFELPLQPFGKLICL